MALLEVKNLQAGYGGLEILRGINLAVGKHETVAIIGPNGAGKSTILKSIVGLADVTVGEILWKGQSLRGLPTHRLLEKGIGYVPQGRLVFPSLTVRENLEMGGYLIDHQPTLQANLERIFSYFPVLRQKQKIPGGSLSGGQQQMLAIGRALMMTPELLILDEPSLGLAPKITAEVFEKLAEIKAAGTAILVVEQNVRLVLRYASRGYLLVAGVVRHEGPAAALANEKLMHEAFLV